ncbi:rap guanine nucleotide exchange factor 2 isoform X4 [Strongylocentrotus purpuratus]|uniref:Rap guanine nucleotide exchange factor 2 n=1 Tax=Strongylocentrotus purpuratus TaxID=7668 RepID=A0A7M7NEU6_STRPU|nr:rap guanine nucleotide exchange factor 2 isoform X4 [Strongylocentrotus purpuratus]
MSVYIDVHFIRCLKRNPDERTQDDLQCIFAHLHDLEALRSLREPAIREIAKTVRYERHEANDILYCRDDLSTCWFILLSGSVFIDHAMYLPRSSFGKRTSGSGRRGTDCLILEPSELLVLLHPGQRQSCTPTNLERLMALEQDEVKVSANHRGRSLSEDRSHEDDHEPLPSIRLERALSVGSEKKYNKKDLDDVQIIMDNNPDSHPRHLMALSAHNTPTHTVSSGDRSSMHSSMSSSYSDIYSAAENQDLDLSGLVESTVDSDEEESSESGSLLVRDLVRDCLEKDPMHRTEDEIELLLDFMRHLPAFANMTMSVRRALCSVMVFAVVSKAGTVVMKDGEELDSWSVILNGHVEVSKPDESVDELHLGDSFGVKPTMEKQTHSGVMRTTVDDCQFVCIAQEHYYRILTQGEENIRRISEDGVLVMVTEHRVLDERRFGHVVIKATPDRLVSHLIANHSPIDPTYVEDFLMTYRTYMDSPHQICSCLLHWFHDIEMRDKVTRVVLLWVNNYYNDFESNFDMIEFLEEFEDNLEKENMTGQLRLLHIAGAAKAKPRTVILARSDRESSLAFSIVGGWEKKMGIFISKVDKGSKAQKVGLRKGDQIQEVNGHNFEHVTNEKAEKILKGTTHLSIIVKYNTLAFRDLLASQDSRPGSTGRRASQEIALLQSDPLARLGLPDMTMSFTGPEIKDKSKLDKKGAFGKNKAKLMRTMAKLSILPNKPNAKDDNVSAGLMRSGRANSLASNPYLSNSNPDLSSLPSVSYFDGGGGGGYGYNDFPEHVLKIYKADQSCKYFLVHKETTANEVTMLSMREFNVTEPACTGKYSLCEVTVGQGGLVKQKRLPDHQANIASKLSLNGRLFLKNNMASETLMPDEVAVELLKESQVNFLQLDSVEVAVQFSLRDYAIFEAIEPTDYIEDLFNLKPQGKKDIDRLKAYEELVNLEMFWVISEVVSEPSIMKRAKILKNFIKIARHFKDCHNFNSLFAVISGLGHGSVSRLRLAWDKVPSKYIKMFEDLQALLDPSRNMSKYRNLINAENVQPPLMPFFPIVKKDLTFIHLGNDSYVEGLINFEKQRMVAREVRYFHSMGNAPYDPKHLLTPVQTQSNSYGFSVVSGTATLPRKRNQNRRNSGLLNPKKMWEEAQMSRRVKMYMANLTVIQDEDQLRDMSLRCEPVASSGGSSSNSGSYATLPRRTHHNSASNVSQSSLDPSDTASISSSSSLMPPPSQTASSGRLPHPKPSSPTHGRDPREEKLKQIIYKDAPKTSFGATSPKNLKKLLSLSEEGDKHIKTLRMDRSSKGDDTVASMMSSPPTSPGAKSSKRFRKLGIVNKMNNMSTGSLEPRQRRPLSPQRSDSGYGGSEAGSQSGRVEHDPRRRHTVASGPPASAFIGGGIGAYDSSDSGGGLSYDTQSNSSFGSSSPPTRDNRFVRDAGTHSMHTYNKAQAFTCGQRGYASYPRPRPPPDYHTVRKTVSHKKVPPPKLYSPPPQEMQERKPPDYEIAAARARDLPRSSESCDFYDSDNEQVSVV